MPIENLDPPAAHKAMSQDPRHVFLDVRTVQEFEAGHPRGALNVPWSELDPSTGQMSKNPHFVSTVLKHVGKDRTVYVSCQAGVRSLNACNALEPAGYAKLVNVTSGYGGRRDPSGGIVIPGWRDAGLPIEQGLSDYPKLKA